MPYTYGTDEWEKAYVELANQRMASESKPYWMGTPEWLMSYEKIVQGDAAYKEAAKTWEGSVVIHILAKPELGIDSDLYLYMDLWHGDCNWMRLVPPEKGSAGDFVITGDFERWKSVMAKELDPVKGMMQGKLKLKGDLPTIVRAVRAAQRLVELVGEIPTKFPDEVGADELAEFKSTVSALRSDFGI
ncbi:MAG: SCP2 sterol-binding domain-containing protein [Candidatus Geothermincolia bacterium]